MSADEWRRLAQLSGTSVAYLNQMALGFRRPSVAMAERIEEAVSKVSPTLKLSKESLIFLHYGKQIVRCDMSQQSTVMPDPRYFQKLLPRSIWYDPISGVYNLIAKREE